MKALVTGASSFIGKYLTRKLKQLGHEVIGTYFKNQLEIPGIKFISLNLNNFEKIRLLLEEYRFDIVFHLASYMPKHQGTPEIEVVKKCVNVNGIGTYYLLNCCHKKGIKKFVYPSTATIYERYTTSLPAKENYVSPYNVHSASKYLGETFCEYFRRKKNFNTISLRLSSVYGFGQKPYCVLPIFVEKAIRNEDIEVWGNGVRTQDFIYVEDVVNALIKAAFSNTVGIFNIGSGKETSMYSLAESVKKIFNPNIKIITKPIRKEDVSRFFLDMSKAKKELGFQAEYSLESGLREYQKRLGEYRENRLNF